MTDTGVLPRTGQGRVQAPREASGVPTALLCQASSAGGLEASGSEKTFAQPDARSAERVWRTRRRPRGKRPAAPPVRAPPSVSGPRALGQASGASSRAAPSAGSRGSPPGGASCPPQDVPGAPGAWAGGT